MATAELSLLRLLPPIRRARAYRLYAEDGRRFLDLWQDDGRGILGAKGTGLGTVAKAAIDKGLALPLPSVHEERLQKGLMRLYTNWDKFVLFRDEASARAAVQGLAPGASLGLVRPFGKAFGALYPEAGEASAALVRLPCPAALGPGVLALKGEATEWGFAQDPLPPLLLATAAKGLQEFEAYAASWGEEAWRRADSRCARLFERSGPYLKPRCPKEDYPALFAAALGAGVLLSPRYELPSLVPGDFDDGELKALSSL